MGTTRPTWGALLLTGLLTVASTRAVRAGTAQPDLLEMEVLGVVPLEAETASLLILRQKGARTVLPIFVGRLEGTALEKRLKHPAARQGYGADLLARAIDALGGTVSRVAIDGAHAALFSAHVTLQQGGRTVDVEARPSESVALAIAAHAPIYATRQLVAAAGLSEEDLARSDLGARKRPGRDAEPDGTGAGPEQRF